MAKQLCYYCEVLDEEENLVDSIHNGASIKAHQKCIDSYEAQPYDEEEEEEEETK